MTNVVDANNNVVPVNNIVVPKESLMPEKYLKGRASVWPEEDGQPPQTVYFQPPKNRTYNARWLLLWQDSSDIGVSMTEQAEMDVLTKTEYRVRDWLMGTIGIGNYVHVNQAEMARRLRIQRADASRAIKRLIALGILIQGPKSGRSNTYMVSPAFCFAGGLGNGLKARKNAIAKVIPFKSDDA